MYVIFSSLILFILIILPVKRVHWLCARAQHLRWREECILVRYEMEWTVRYFLHKSHLWMLGDTTDVSPSAVAYAHRQVAMWHDLAHYADQSFKTVNVNYKSPV